MEIDVDLAVSHYSFPAFVPISEARHIHIRVICVG